MSEGCPSRLQSTQSGISFFPAASILTSATQLLQSPHQFIRHIKAAVFAGLGVEFHPRPG